MPLTRPVPSDVPAFQALQYRFAAHVRDPRRPPPPGLEDRRLAVYRELLFNNIAGFLADYFPVLRRITPAARWQAMVRDFFARHRARTPLFPQMAREFLRYLEEERDDAEDPPFLRELAHYEWIEAALAIDPRDAQLPAGAAASADLLAGRPVLSPLAWALRYRFPVHRIGPGFQPREAPPQPTYLLVYRDGGDVVRFLELNEVTARLLDLLAAPGGQSGAELLAQIAAELRHPQPQAVIEAGAALLADLRLRGVVLGARARSA